MLAYVFRRLVQAVLILLGVTVVTYALLFLVPADPARQIAGRSATPETVANIREQLGLNLPFYQQYGIYLWNLLHGDLGRSYLQKSEVSALIASRLPATLLLMVGAIFCELLFGLTSGVIASLRRGTATDNALWSRPSSASRRRSSSSASCCSTSSRCSSAGFRSAATARSSTSSCRR